MKMKLTDLLLFLVIALPDWCGAAPQESNVSRQLLLAPESWPQACRQLQQALLDGSRDSMVRFSPKPARQAEQQPAWWLLTWQGVSVPIPESEYQDVLLLGRKKGVTELLLRGDAVTVALMLSPLDAPMNDFPANVAGKGQSSQKGSKAQEERFSLSTLIGSTASSAEVLMAAYRTKSFTCAAENRRAELMAFAGLPLLQIAGPHSVQSVYESVGTRRGWLEVGQNKDKKQQVWRAITVGQPSLPGLQIEVTTPITPPFAAIGLDIGATDARASQHPAPAWLNVLQTAVTDNAPASLKALRKSLQESGMSARSVQRLEAFMQSP